MTARSRPRKPPRLPSNWKTGKGMIERMGYHRRDNEVNELAEQLA